MQEVQNALRQLNHTEDPLQTIADRIAQQTRLLCFDEFHVSDIADAMILGRLLEMLLDRGVIFVMTSNYPPDGLYPNGLQRSRFLPTIDLIKARFDVLEMDHGTDYRLRTLAALNMFLTPLGPGADQKLAQAFEQISGGRVLNGKFIRVLDRDIPMIRRGGGVIWFDFADLCEGARSQNDYLEIAREHHTLLLSNIPRMDARHASSARRFTWLIDVLYDCRVKFMAGAEVAAEVLYTEGVNAHEFARTVSRLQEMRSQEYLAEEHRNS